MAVSGTWKTHILLLGSKDTDMGCHTYCGRNVVAYGMFYVRVSEVDAFAGSDPGRPLCRTCVRSLARYDREHAATGNPRRIGGVQR